MRRGPRACGRRTASIVVPAVASSPSWASAASRETAPRRARRASASSGGIDGAGARPAATAALAEVGAASKKRARRQSRHVRRKKRALRARGTALRRMEAAVRRLRWRDHARTRPHQKKSARAARRGAAREGARARGRILPTPPIRTLLPPSSLGAHAQEVVAVGEHRRVPWRRRPRTRARRAAPRVARARRSAPAHATAIKTHANRPDRHPPPRTHTAIASIQHTRASRRFHGGTSERSKRTEKAHAHAQTEGEAEARPRQKTENERETETETETEPESNTEATPFQSLYHRLVL